METRKTKKMELIKFIIFLLCIGVFFSLKEVSKNETDRILKNGKYVVGVVLEFSSGTGSLIAPRILNQPGTPGYVKYKYVVDRHEYLNRYDANTAKIPMENVNVGDKFLVIFLKNDPGESRMLFDKPIKNNSDIERYLNELEK